MTEIRNGKRVIITPVSYEDIMDLNTGDVIYIDGYLVTGRDSVHGRVVNEGLSMPVDINDGVILHAGPIVRETDMGYEIVSAGPTTSMRMEKFEYDFIEKTGVRIIVGKGGMSEKTARGCVEFGTLHCVFPAGNAVVAAQCVESVESADWLDLGMPEAVWKCKVKEFGPLIVSIDTKGRNLYEEKKAEYEKIKEAEIAKLSKYVDYMK